MPINVSQVRTVVDSWFDDDIVVGLMRDVTVRFVDAITVDEEDGVTKTFVEWDTQGYIRPVTQDDIQRLGGAVRANDTKISVDRSELLAFASRLVDTRDRVQLDSDDNTEYAVVQVVDRPAVGLILIIARN